MLRAMISRSATRSPDWRRDNFSLDRFASSLPASERSGLSSPKCITTGGKADVSPLPPTLNVEFKRSNQSPNHIERLPHNYYQGFTFTNPKLVERYLKSELYILVHFRIRRIGEEMLALFHKQCLSAADPPISGVSEKASGSVGGSQMLADIKLPYRCSGSQQQAMFVSDIEVMEPPKMSIPSLVRFGLLNDIDSFLPHSLYLSRKRGLLLLGSRDSLEDGVSGKFVGRSAFRPDQSIGQIVERASDVLEDVASDQQNFRGDGCNLGSIVDMLSSVRISLYADRIGVNGNELIESGMQIVDVLIGPLDL